MVSILTNKYFLFFLFFLAIAGLIFFSLRHQYKNAILFLLVGVLARCYTGNMIIVLLTAFGITLLYTLFTKNTEGFGEAAQHAADTKVATGSAGTTAENNIQAKTAELQTAKQNATTAASTTTTPPPIAAASHTSLNTNSLKQDEQFTNQKDKKSNQNNQNNQIDNNTAQSNGKNRLNYAANVQNAYQNLESLVGGDGIEKLTQQTSQLLQHQSKLVDTMKHLSPLMEQVRGMIKSFEGVSPQNLVNA
jgi:cytoskeletal protein RodZ